ncbi:hypothetical protein Gotur_030682 [Gossypium turneri]
MKQFNGKEIDEWVVCYIRELERIEERNITRSRGNEEWNPPIDSLIKINFDASFNQTHAKVGSRVVARNASVEIVASKMVFYIEVASPFMAESHACLQVLLLGIQLRFRAMVVEGDARTIIKKCHMCPRSANTLAHVLATKSLKRDREDYLEGVPNFFAEAMRRRPREPD